MPYTKQEIQTIYSLSPEDVEQKLTSANLPLDQETYTDEEIQSSFVLDEEFNDGQATQNTVVAERSEPDTEQLDLPKKTRKGKKLSKSDENGVSESKCLNISELLSLASAKVGARISLIEAGLILDACGLPDQEQYSDSEAEQFLKGCLLKTQGKSCEEIAAHFNVSSAVNGNGKPESDKLKQAAIHFAEQIGDSATAAKLGFSHLIDLVTAEEAANLPEMVNRSFLKHASRKLDESKTHIEVFYAELEEHVIAQIEGKTQAHSLEATWEWAQNSLPPSLPKPTSLPEDSESGTNTD